MKFIFLFFAIVISAAAAEITYLPLSLQTYQRVTLENLDEHCPIKGKYQLKHLHFVDASKCTEIPKEKLNLRIRIDDGPERAILIGRNNQIWLNNFACVLAPTEFEQVVSEIEKIHRGRKGVCKRK